MESTSSYLFGTATTGDINELKEMIKKVEATVQTEAADSARVREGLAQYTKLQNDRMDNLKNVLQEEHKTFEAVFKEVRANAASGQLE